MKVPRWLKLQEQIDYSLFELGQIYKDVTNRSGLDILIDQSTRHDKEQLKYAKKLMNKIDRMKKEYYKITGSPSVDGERVI